MIAALTLLLPLSLGGAVSPMMLAEQTVLLGSGGRRPANRYALGAALTLLAILAALVFLGHLLQLPTEPKLSASLDIALGVGLLAIGSAIGLLGSHAERRRRERHRGSKRHHGLANRPEAAFPFGVFSMATNFTTLALVAVAAKEISAQDLDTAERLILILVVVAICSLPAWIPLLATRLAPETGRKALEAISRFVTDHGRTVVIVLFLGAGAFLIARGIFNI